MKTAEQQYADERRKATSACADAATHVADGMVAHLSPRQLADHRQQFNARLAELIAAGRIAK